MATRMDDAVRPMKLTTLTELSISELQRQWLKDPFDDRYRLELLRRALVEQTDEAWFLLQQCFSQTLRAWLRSHPSCDMVLLRDSEENYLAQTFARFWYAVHDQHLEFSSWYAALRYVRATLNGIILDTVRFHLRLCSREIPFPEPGCAQEPWVEDCVDSRNVWESIEIMLCDERERRLVYLVYPF